MKTLEELDAMYYEIGYEEYWRLKDERVKYLEDARANDTITFYELDELLNYYGEDDEEDDCIDEAERVGLHQTQWGWM